MDKSFMRDFYQKYYSDPFQAAIEDSDLFREKREIRYRMEEELITLLGGTRTEAYRKFDEYVSAWADEYDVMLEEMYLLGASDREKMLK